ncbi:MAG TPA: P-loop NTPase fold protein [Solirubrobacteraceae bacterium]|nr:P-loop NTPase fold protein [Solirubrobacteraceae bacterium]
MSSFTLLGDQPQTGVADPLGFDGLASGLAETVIASRKASPFTLGILAGWGMGKSTLMLSLRAKLDEQPDIATVWFNAWSAGDTGTLEGLIKTVLNEMDANVLRRALRKKQLMSWVRVIVSVVAGFLRVGNVVDELWRSVEVDPRTRNELRELMQEAIGRWREKNSGVPGGRLLCVFIDDLDRASPQGVFDVFEAVKLYLDVEGLVFVIGYDEEIVSEAILEKKHYSKAIKSHDYLEKIVQITYRIPRPGLEQASALLDACTSESGALESFERAERSLVIEQNERNPRRIKRFVNGFRLAYGMNAEWRSYTSDSLIRVHLLYMYFPLFARMLDSPGERDPVEEFVTYRTAREALRRRVDRSDEQWASVRRAFESYELTPPPLEPAALLSSLEQYVPNLFPQLAGEEEFVSLISSLGDSREWLMLRTQLSEGGGPRPGASDGEASAPPPITATVELRALVVGGGGTADRSLARGLHERAARATFVASFAEANALLTRRSGFEALVVMLDRGDGPDASLDEVERLREANLAPPLVAALTSRPTPVLEARARSMGVLMTDDETVLIEWLAAPEQRGTGGPPAPTQTSPPTPSDGPAEAAAARELADDLSSQGEIGRAIDVYAGAAKGGDAQASVKLGHLLLQQGERVGAESAYRAAVEAGDPDAMFSLAVLLGEQQRTAEELELYDELAARFGDSTDPSLQELSARALYNKGIVLEERSNFPEALGVFEKLIGRYGESAEPRLREQTARAFLNMGVVLGNLDRSQDELLAYEQLVDRYGDSTEPVLREQTARALFNRAVTLAELDREDEALPIYDELIDRYGDSPEPRLREPAASALLNKGGVLARRGLKEDALRVYEELVDRYGESTEPRLREETAKALANRGMLLAELKRSDHALAVYGELIDRYADSTEPALRERTARALLDKAILFQDLEQRDEALATVNEVIARYGKDESQAVLAIVADATILRELLEEQSEDEEE